MTEKSPGATRRAPPRRAAEADVDPSRRALDLGPLSQRLGYVLRRAQLAVFQDFFSSFAALDVSPAQYSALAVIEANPGCSQTQVAEALGIQKSNFVTMISALEKRGVVRREASPSDGRTYRLSLSRQGSILVRELHDVAEAHERRIASIMGEDAYARLFTPLRAIAEGLRGDP